MKKRAVISFCLIIVSVSYTHLVLQAAPHLFKNAGPGCLRGKCPEGKMSCGKMEEVRAYFKKMKEMCIRDRRCAVLPMCLRKSSKR